jgi:hypothetical protein
MRMLLVLASLLPLALAACDKKPQDPNGVGPWQFGRSKLADAETAGRCLPIEGGQMHCIGLSAMQVGGQVGDTQVYFASAEKSAPLIEISLAIKACDASAVANDLGGRIGMPQERGPDGATLYWSLSTMFVRALVPDKKTGESQLNFVLPTDAQRIADLKAGK